MPNFKRAFWSTLAALIVLWMIAEPEVFQSATFLPFAGRWCNTAASSRWAA